MVLRSRGSILLTIVTGNDEAVSSQCSRDVGGAECSVGGAECSVGGVCRRRPFGPFTVVVDSNCLVTEE